MDAEHAALVTYRFVKQAREELAEQLFWAYPPPYVQEDARPAGERHLNVPSYTALRMLREGRALPAQFPNASLELYRRYKYGPMERKYFRDVARRRAAYYMVQAYLAGKGQHA